MQSGSEVPAMPGMESSHLLLPEAVAGAELVGAAYAAAVQRPTCGMSSGFHFVLPERGTATNRKRPFRSSE
jgi:hypothetical protein